MMALRPLARRPQSRLGQIVRRPQPRGLRLWAPTTPLVVVLAPLALLAIPILELVFARRGFRPARAILALGALLFALSGTTVEIDSPKFKFGIRIL